MTPTLRAYIEARLARLQLALDNAPRQAVPPAERTEWEQEHTVLTRVLTSYDKLVEQDADDRQKVPAYTPGRYGDG